MLFYSTNTPKTEYHHLINRTVGVGGLWSFRVIYFIIIFIFKHLMKFNGFVQGFFYCLHHLTVTYGMLESSSSEILSGSSLLNDAFKSIYIHIIWHIK